MSKDKVSYYGPFFWVAAISFLVPLAVAAKAFHEVRLTTRPTPRLDISGVDHAIWDYLLKKYVANGLINYDGMSRDYLFQTYLRQLSEADPSALTTSADKLALLCNAYNAFVVDGVTTHKIHDSVMNFRFEEKEFFDVPEHLFCGQTMSLNHIEHEIVRKLFKEPRVHVALVCAARSCPSIRAEAYVGLRLTQQLEDQSIQFANNPKYVAFDAEKGTLFLSPILKWYGDDWSVVGGYLPWLASRVREPTLKAAIAAAARGEVPVDYFAYDWSLNSQAPSESSAVAAPAKSAEFGSGSIPNE